MTWVEALLLGVIQGLTEFLPVSSSGHLEIGSVLLGTSTGDNLLFAVIVHAATALSTLIVFRRDIINILLGLFDLKWNDSWKFFVLIIISMIPVGIAGVFFEEEISGFFSGNLVLVGSMLLFTSALLFFTYFKNDGTKDVSYLQAIIMGIAQTIAILPGISRSGATIATGLLIGVDKERATRFSFLMVLPPILGASLLKFIDYLEAPSMHQGLGTIPILVGFLAALISGYMACRWMVNIVKKGRLYYFAIYCLIVGVIAIISQVPWN